MAQIAIMAAVGLAIGAAQSALAPKPPRQRVDKGRADDIRIMTADEGIFLPRFKGWGRAAPNIIWHTDIIESYQTQTVGGGGKNGGGGGSQTEEERTFSYTTSLCCAISVGPVWNGLRRIWADNEMVLNISGDTGGYFEGEDSSNTRTGTATIEAYDAASGRQELTLNPGATVQFNSVLSHGAKTRPFTMYFRTGAVTPYEVYVNGVLVSTNSFPNTGDSVYQTRTISVALNDGLNTIKIKNTSPTFNLGIDRIFVFPGFEDDDQVTGVISELDFTVVAPDPNLPAPYYDDPPVFDPGDGPGGLGGGSGSGGLTGLGGAQFFFYIGSEDQPQDPTMVAEDGADQVPAYRGVFICMIKDLVLKSPNLPNITFEFDEGTHDLAVAVTDYYKEAGAKDSELDMADLEGIHFIGHVIDQLRPLEEHLKLLEDWYNFDLLPIDGKIKAVLRGGSIVETIPEDKLGAYEEGGEPPPGPVAIEYIDPSVLPRELDISYLEVAKDYHTATEPAVRAVGLNQSAEAENYPIVAESDEAVQVGLRRLYQRYIERPVEFTTGPEYHHRSPTDPFQLVLENTTHRVRVTGKQAPPGGGLIRWKGETEDVSVYTQTLAPGLTGFEPPVVDYPANSVFVIIDAPLVRPEDAGDGSSPVIILAMCKRGTTRPWRGGVAFKEEITDEWLRQTTFSVNSKIGTLRATLADCADVTAFDRANTFTVDFWNPVTFESFAEDDLVKKANVNLFWVGINGGQGEFVQAAIATPVTPLTGYKSAYTFSVLLRGRFLTEYATSGHAADELMVVVDTTLKPRRCDLKELQALRRWVGASVGQGINEALEVAALDFTLQGNSLKPPTVANTRSTHNAEGSKLIEFEGRTRKGGGLRSGQGGAIHEEAEEYRVQILNGGAATLPNGKTRVLPIALGTSQAALMLPGNSLADISGNSLGSNTASTAYARVVQKALKSGFFIEGTAVVPSGPGGGHSAGIRFAYLNSDPTNNNNVPYQLTVGNAVYNITEFGILKVSFAPAVNGSRWRVMFSGSEVRFYANYINSGSKPVYISRVAPVYPLDIIVTAGNLGEMQSVVLSTLTPSTVYSADQQTEDGFTPGDPIEMDIWQHSPIVGAGQKLRVTL